MADKLPTWTRDELILALELYARHGQLDDLHPEVIALSRYLRSLPAAVAYSPNAKYRNPNGVALKLANFASLDPSYPGRGMSGGGKGTEPAVWAEFSGDPARLAEVAAAIRQSLSTADPELLNPVEDEEDVAEGRVLFRQHRARERNRKVINDKKKAVLAATGTLACEVCGFDFEARFGARGAGFAECHHRLPLSRSGPTRTALKDLAIVCSNCHRMLHRSPWLTVEQLRLVARLP